jgi:regulator of RNase E activity RraA
MKKISLVICSLALAISMNAQTISKEELIFLTSEWKGERFSDGRPKLADDLLIRARKIMVDDAWTVLKNEGYVNQFEGNWKMVNDSVPVIGRAVTAMFMPTRPDIEKNIKERGAKAGRKGNTNAWPIELLQQGDVYVADAFGKIAGGTLMGSTLANSIYAKTGNGVVFNGASRDLQELKMIKGNFNAFVRDFHPSFLEETVLMGLNTPVRIGNTMVLPGDLVIGFGEGVLFVPAHMAEQVVSTAEFVVRKDKFGYEMLKAGTYSAGQIDSQWTDQIKNDFLKWLEKHPELGRMTRADLDKVMSKRTW